MKIQSYQLFIESNQEHQEIETITREDFVEISDAGKEFKPEEIEQIQNILYKHFGINLFVGKSDYSITIGYHIHSMDIITDGDFYLYIKEEILENGKTIYYYTKVDIGFGFTPFREFINNHSKVKKV